jgi:hypothetical protein
LYKGVSSNLSAVVQELARRITTTTDMIINSLFLAITIPLLICVNIIAYGYIVCKGNHRGTPNDKDTIQILFKSHFVVIGQTCFITPLFQNF